MVLLPFSDDQFNAVRETDKPDFNSLVLLTYINERRVALQCCKSHNPEVSFKKTFQALLARL